MPYSFTDKYLGSRVDVLIETRAAADVATYGTFEEPWLGRLIVLRSYILVCLDHSAKSDDAFSSKLAQYRLEWKEVMAAAKRAAALAETDASQRPSLFSIPLERG